MEALHLAGGGGRAGRGEQMTDAVLPAYAVKEHLPATGAEPPGEDLAVVGEDLVGDPVAAQGFGESLAHRPGRGPQDELGRDAEAGVVVEAGDHLELGAVREHHPTHHVHLPELHRAGAFPTPIVRALALAGLRGDETVSKQTAVDGGAGGDGDTSLFLQLMLQGEGTPLRVLHPQGDDPGLDLREHLMGAARRPGGVVGETAQAVHAIPPKPPVHRLPRDPVSLGHVGDRHPGEHLENRLIALLHQLKLHEHDSALPARICLLKRHIRAGAVPARGPKKWNTGTGACVAHLPEQVSHRYRSCVRKVEHRYRSRCMESMYRDSTQKGAHLAPHPEDATNDSAHGLAHESPPSEQ